MSDRDEDLLRRYRAMARETPPAALDASILAASRRAARARPRLRRWAAPLSVAAVLVLALGIVLKVQREAPDAGMPAARQAPTAAPAAPAAQAPTPAPEPQAPPSAAAAVTSAEPSARRDAMSSGNLAPAAPAARKKALAADSPQRELERVARLREEGKDEEADAALAAFRREHPGYRIDPATWDRVRRR